MRGVALARRFAARVPRGLLVLVVLAAACGVERDDGAPSDAPPASTQGDALTDAPDAPGEHDAPTEAGERDTDRAPPGDALEPAAPNDGVGSAGRSDVEVPALHPDVDGWDAALVTIERAGDAAGTEGDAQLVVRIARSSEQLRRGLMGVETLPDGAGMLFDFGATRTGGFWMKDTLVALDIAFVTADGAIVSMLTMTPCVEDPCPSYDPGVAYRQALEVPAGWFARKGIEVGDEVRVVPIATGRAR